MALSDLSGTSQSLDAMSYPSRDPTVGTTGTRAHPSPYCRITGASEITGHAASRAIDGTTSDAACQVGATCQCRQDSACSIRQHGTSPSVQCVEGHPSVLDRDSIDIDDGQSGT